MRYKVRYFQDNTYEVYGRNDDEESLYSFFQGSLSDCEAWIRLKEGGYLN